MYFRSSGQEYAVESTPGVTKVTGLERSKSSHTVKFKEDTTEKQVKVEKKKSFSFGKSSKETSTGEQKKTKDNPNVLQRSEPAKPEMEPKPKTPSFVEKLRSLSSEKKEAKEVSISDIEEDARPKTPSFVEKLKSSKSMEKLSGLFGGASEDRSNDEVPRPKTPTFMGKLKSAKSKEKPAETEADNESSLIGRMRGRSMERKADIYAKIKETREIVQNTQKDIVVSFENTEKVITEKFDQIRTKSQEAKKRIMWNQADVEAIEAARNDIVKTEVNKSGMYKVSSLEREKSKSSERKTSKSNSSEKANKDPKKIEKSSSSEKADKKSKKSENSEMKDEVENEPKPAKSSMFNRYSGFFEDKASEVKNLANKFTESRQENVEDKMSDELSKPSMFDKYSKALEEKASGVKSLANRFTESVAAKDIVIEEVKTSEETSKSSMISKYTKAFTANEDKSSEFKSVANKFNITAPQQFDSTQSQSNSTSKQLSVIPKEEVVEEKKSNIEDLYSKVNKKTKKQDEKVSFLFLIFHSSKKLFS